MGSTAQDPSGDAILAPGEPERAEQDARRLLGLEAGGAILLGAVVLGAARPVGRQVRLPAWLVRMASLGAVGWGAGVGVASLAEDWQAPTRRVVVGNAGTAAVLTGLALVRGRLAGRVGAATLAAGLGGLAYRQARSLAEGQGPVVAG